MTWVERLQHRIWLRLIGPEGVEDRRREVETRKVISEAQAAIERLTTKLEHPVFNDRREGDAPQ